jgi:hypothetical protein
VWHDQHEHARLTHILGSIEANQGREIVELRFEQYRRRGNAVGPAWREGDDLVFVQVVIGKAVLFRSSSVSPLTSPQHFDDQGIRPVRFLCEDGNGD